MSATINQKDLKFVVFGSGHDYTLLDSGTGEGARFFSHPLVPLGSTNGVCQYYFVVPDENGNLIDAVKDDIAHCTFTPAIGSTFNAEGEVDIKVEYEHEYIHDEETILVKKSFTQTITVVNHGSVSSTGTNCTKYSDGYCFFKVSNDNTVGGASTNYKVPSGGTKVSTLPWRLTDLTYNITLCGDISELQYFDCSTITSIGGIFYNIPDITGVEGWDTSNVTYMDALFWGNTTISDISALANWNTSKVTWMEGLFSGCDNLTDLTPLANWDVSKVTVMDELFSSCIGVTDLTPLANWDVSSVESLCYTFNRMGIQSLDGLENWDVSNVKYFNNGYGDAIFDYCQSLTDISAITNWDVSSAIDLNSIFADCTNLSDISALANWDVSNCEKVGFSQIPITDLTPLANWDVSNCTAIWFGDLPEITSLHGLENWVSHNLDQVEIASCPKLTDISAVANWDVSHVTYFNWCFHSNTSLANLHGMENWDVSNVTSMYNAFGDCTKLADISALANWRPSSCTDFHYLFNRCSKLSSLVGLENWTVSLVKDMYSMFNGTAVHDTTPLLNWNTSSLEDVRYMFKVTGVDASHPLNLAGLANWNMSKCKRFDYMFSGITYVSNLSAIGNWDMSKATNISYLIDSILTLTSVSDLANWRFSSGVSMGNSMPTYWYAYSAKLLRDVWRGASSTYWFDADGHSLSQSDVESEMYPLQYYTKDATDAQNWLSSGSGKGAFNATWSNRPSWN